MKIRNKRTGQIFEVVAGTLYPSFFEEVKDEPKDDQIKVGEPKVEYVVEELKEEPVEEKPKAKTTRKRPTRKTTKKGVKKNDTSAK